MKRILHFDASAGVSGDMFVGALLDAGADLQVVRGHLSCLGLEGFEVGSRKVVSHGISGTKFDVVDPTSGRSVDALPDGHDDAHGHGRIHGHEHRGLREIRRLLRASPLPPPVAEEALAIFELLAAAEARVHGTKPEEVHFHEVGALDAIADVVAAVSVFRQLGAEEAWCSPVHVGSGTVRCAHGILPVPAPATLELLKGAPAYSDGIRGELATPTGMALIRHFCAGFSAMPPMVVEAVGYGAGSRDFGIPNLLRVTVGRVGSGSLPVQEARRG